MRLLPVGSADESQDILQIGLWIVTIELGRLDLAHDRGGAFGFSTTIESTIFSGHYLHSLSRQFTDGFRKRTAAPY